MKLVLLFLFSVLSISVAFRPFPQKCPNKCYFPLKSLPRRRSKIPCPYNCKFYACLVTFGPMLPAFGIGIACADTGLSTKSPPQDLPRGTYSSCFSKPQAIKNLSFLSDSLPADTIPKCPRACKCFIGKNTRVCGLSAYSQPPKRCERKGKRGKRCCSLAISIYN